MGLNTRCLRQMLAVGLARRFTVGLALGLGLGLDLSPAMAGPAATESPAALYPKANPQPVPNTGASAQQNADAKVQGVVVVLAGGGAKGFAHLALLRRLERERVPIARIVGTSMGAVIGGLYASGLSPDRIEQVIASLDPARVALDQLDRLELPLRTRAEQRRYPIGLEFGLKDGTVGFARGMSDGQRFLTLLQELTAHVPPDVHFDQLRIPFRAVATRYRDGEMTVFRQGSLHLAIRASMAAPAVFAPVEIGGETYVDGGLVANLPIEVALTEGAGVIVASYLGQAPLDDAEPANALTVANRMLDILIRQNEQRNLALLRPQDVLVAPQFNGLGFGDFNRAPEMLAAGDQAVEAQAARLAALAPPVAVVSDPPAAPDFSQREIRLTEVRVTGTEHVSERFVYNAFAPLLGETFRADMLAARVDNLYTSGFFERVSYQLEQLHNDQYGLVVQVQEKTYGPHYFKTSLGFSAERDGVNQFSLGLGYRRPWLTAQGLEVAVDARAGTQSELGVRLFQPLGRRLGLQAHGLYTSNLQPVYAQDRGLASPGTRKLAYADVSQREWGLMLTREWGRTALWRLGWVGNDLRHDSDTASAVLVSDARGAQQVFSLDPARLRYRGWRLQVVADQLDSVSFPQRGYGLQATFEHGVQGASFSSARLSARWAFSHGRQVLNTGLNLGATRSEGLCENCFSPANLYLGGFQNLGAWRMGQLSGNRLAHGFATWMVRLSDGGLLRQKSFAGLVLEAGNVWFQDQPHRTRYSGTLFFAVDSRIGDVYLGLARGSGGMTNAFVQLGRRFGD